VPGGVAGLVSGFGVTVADSERPALRIALLIGADAQMFGVSGNRLQLDVLIIA
jgi:hypothetical protein